MELNPYRIGSILSKGGYTKEKGKSSHACFKKKGCPTIRIPEHRGQDIDRAIYFQIIKKVCLPEKLKAKLR